MRMPEISEQEWSELKAQVANLSTQMNATRNRIQDLEDFASGHLGLDWGESLVDANSPHPNISVNTIESGGGIIRQDVNAMQIVTGDDTQQKAIRWVPRLSDDPSVVYPHASVAGTADSGNLSAEVVLGAFAAGGANSSAQVIVTDTEAKIDLQVLGDAGVTTFGEVEIFADSSLSYVRMSGQVRIASGISPAQITANQNNYNPTDLATASVLRLSSDASRDITGLAGGADGRILLVFNVGSNNIVLKDESASSTAANRFALNGDITLAADDSVILWYDATSSRWRAL